MVLCYAQNGGMNQNQDVLLTVADAARVGKVPYWTVQGWIHKRQLPVVHQGRSVFIQRGELVKFLRPVCPLCGDRFRRANARQVYCTDACRKNAHRVKAGTP